MSEHQQTQQSRKPDSTFQKQAALTSQMHVSSPASIIQRVGINPKSLTSADVLQLQRTIGNRAVGRLLSEIRNPSKVQQATVQRQEIPEEEEPLQGKMIGTIQRQEIPEEEEPLQTKKENNTGMPNNLKAGVESMSGIDMSDVRVHYNSSKPADVGALAYTQGTNIHVAPGQERHLPHEAWHVVQQAQGRVRPTMQLKEGVPINDDEGLEHEADVMGRKAVASTEKTGKNNANQNKLYRERNNSGQIIITNAIQMEKFKCKVCKKDVDTEDGKLKQARKCPKCFSKAKNTERSKGQGDEYDASGEAHRKTSTKGRTGRTANQGHR